MAMFSSLWFLLLALSVISCPGKGTFVPKADDTVDIDLVSADQIEWKMHPVLSRVPPHVFNETRRKLGSFQICALCTCCGGPKHLCLASPCCYAINCNIPNRPFGFCSFTPKACNCFGCHL